MKPLFYLLLVICFSTIFSCKKEKIAQTPTPASPTTIVPNATVQQLAGVWRYVKSEIYDNNVLFYSADSTERNIVTTSINNNIPYPPSFIEFTTVLSSPNSSRIFNYNQLELGVYSHLGFVLSLPGEPDMSSITNSSVYPKIQNVAESYFIYYTYVNNPNNPPLGSLSQTQQSALGTPIAWNYIRVLDAHNLVVSSWGDNVYATGIKSYYCR